MVLAKRKSIDVRTKKTWEEEIEFTPSPPLPEPIQIDLKELKKLLDYAKSMGWV